MVMMTLVFVTAKQVVTRERSRGGEQCSGDVIHVHKYEIEYRGFEKMENLPHNYLVIVAISTV